MKNNKLDNYGVPKDVNLQVLKVLYYMNEHGHKSPHIYEIYELVEMTMPHTVPSELHCDMSTMVYKSLQNMAKLGVIAKRGKSFYIRSLKFKPYTAPPVIPKIFRMKERQHAISRMDPNLKKLRYLSDESGNEADKARKGFPRGKSQQALLPATEDPQKQSNVDMIEKASQCEVAKTDQTPKTNFATKPKMTPSRYNGLQVYNLNGEKINFPGAGTRSSHSLDDIFAN